MVMLITKPPIEEALQRIKSGDIEWFIKEIDTYTPCVVIQGNKEQKETFERLGFLIDKILTVSKRNFTMRQLGKMVDGIRYSAIHHEGIYRKDKVTPYLLHLLEVAYILIELEVHDFKILLSAILHDVVEDTHATSKDVGKRFGSAVRNIVKLMTMEDISIEKKQLLSFVKKGLRSSFWMSGEETLKKMTQPLEPIEKVEYWKHMKNEPDFNCRWRGIGLKFPDRTHSFMTFNVLSKERQEEVIEETLREFPLLFEVLEQTLAHLYYIKRTIKNKKYFSLALVLMNKLTQEMKPYVKLEDDWFRKNKKTN